MIGDCNVGVIEGLRGSDHLLDGVLTVGRDGMHMQIAADLLRAEQRGNSEFNICLELKTVFP